MKEISGIQATLTVEIVRDLAPADLSDLCEAAEDAILRGGGFGWLTIPERSKLEAYWRGLMIVPGRHLIIARLDGVVAGALQLHEAPKNMESQSLIGQIQSGFTASWARGYGVGRKLASAAIQRARDLNLRALKLDVRETQTAAIKLFGTLGFVQWGQMPRYAYIDNSWVAGLYFYMDL